MHVCPKQPSEKKYLQFFVFVFNFPSTCYIRILPMENNLNWLNFLKRNLLNHVDTAGFRDSQYHQSSVSPSLMSTNFQFSFQAVLIPFSCRLFPHVENNGHWQHQPYKFQPEIQREERAFLCNSNRKARVDSNGPTLSHLPFNEWIWVGVQGEGADIMIDIPPDLEELVKDFP